MNARKREEFRQLFTIYGQLFRLGAWMIGTCLGIAACVALIAGIGGLMLPPSAEPFLVGLSGLVAVGGCILFARKRPWARDS
jgi:hypothetical protein